jgi:hypothetical protein
LFVIFPDAPEVIDSPDWQALRAALATRMVEMLLMELTGKDPGMISRSWRRTPAGMHALLWAS